MKIFWICLDNFESKISLEETNELSIFIFFASSNLSVGVAFAASKHIMVLPGDVSSLIVFAFDISSVLWHSEQIETRGFKQSFRIP